MTEEFKSKTSFNPFDLGLFKPGKFFNGKYNHFGVDYELVYNESEISINTADKEFWFQLNFMTLEEFNIYKETFNSSFGTTQYPDLAIENEDTIIIMGNIKTFDMEKKTRGISNGKELTLSISKFLQKAYPTNEIVLIADWYSTDQSPTMSINFEEFQRHLSEGLSANEAAALTPIGKIMLSVSFTPSVINALEDKVIVYFTRDRNE